MGHVTVDISITNPSGDQTTKVKGLVDTGATFTVVPKAMADRLSLPITGERRVRTANGEIVLKRARALVQIDGQAEINPVLISDSLDRVLIGVFTLESLSLTVDPTTGELNEAETLLF
jgi:aspartyl protease family protein